LVNLARIDLNNDQLSQLTEINTFNIRTRYDDYKRTFYKKATKEYTEEYINYAKEFRIWIKKMYQ
jgi:HEPN domain-containing protein